jgi:signal transduction histidine kinase
VVSWPNETSRVRHWPAFSPERQRLAAGLVLFPAGLVVGILAEQAAFDWDDPRHWVPDLVAGLTFIGAAVVTVPRYPGSGWLLAATGFGWFLGNFDAELQYVHRGPLVHALVVFVGVRVRTRIEFAAVVVGYLAAVIAPIWRNDATSIVLSLALVAVAAYRFGTAMGRARIDRRTAFGAAVVFSVATVGYVVVNNAVPSGEGVEPMLLAYQVALCVVAVVLAVRLRAPRTAVVADLVVELGETRSGTLRDALANALGDPTLEIGYWSPSGAYLDVNGRSVHVPAGGGERAATLVERESRPFAVLVHDRSVLEEPALVDAVAAATRLSAANAALSADVQAQIDELAGSRRRLVLAADEERRRLEVRLHDGVERSVTRLARRLRGLPDSDGAGEHVRRADEHLADTLADLRQIARGLHPRELAGGLPSALAALTERCPIPAELVVDTRRSLTNAVMTAAYYVCAEALANVAKHAGASRVHLEVTDRSDRLRVDVTDNGAGGADPSKGSGLRGLVDRIEALGGTLTVSSKAGGGTRVAAELPLGRHLG